MVTTTTSVARTRGGKGRCGNRNSRRQGRCASFTLRAGLPFEQAVTGSNSRCILRAIAASRWGVGVCSFGGNRGHLSTRLELPASLRKGSFVEEVRTRVRSEVEFAGLVIPAARMCRRGSYRRSAALCALQVGARLLGCPLWPASLRLLARVSASRSQKVIAHSPEDHWCRIVPVEMSGRAQHHVVAGCLSPCLLHSDQLGSLCLRRAIRSRGPTVLRLWHRCQPSRPSSPNPRTGYPRAAQRAPKISVS